MSPKQGSVHFNIDKAVLRDIIEARSVRDKQSFYYIVGSIFSGMSFTMLLLKSDNYSAITFLTMIGIFFYTCISCHNVHYDKDEDVAETESDMDPSVGDANPTPTNTPMMQGVTGLDEVEQFELDYLTKSDKVILFKQLFHELVGADFSDSDLERLIDSSQEVAMDEVYTEQIPEKEEEGAVDPQTKVLAQLQVVEAETAARNLARAQTSFSDSELRQLEEPVIEGKEKTL